jgi:4-amino-4-deoxy-L-arabinose transferase-like glycosyltransferase
VSVRRALPTAIGVTALCVVAGAQAPLIDRDEPRYAEAVREMRASGDWLVPRNYGELRVDKPPMIYWAQAASVALLGEHEVTLRLPSALAAGLLVLLTAGLADNLGADGKEVAGMALPGWCLAGVYATPDALVCALTAVALLALLTAVDGTMRTEAALLGWTALGAGILAKGPVAPLFAGAALVGRLRRDRAATRRIGWTWGLPLAAAVALAWFVPAELATGGAMGRGLIGRHMVGRALAPIEHHGLAAPWGVLLGPPFYALALLVAALPVSLAAKRFIRGRKALPPRLVRTVLFGVGVPVVVLSLVATKLPHYVLAALPLVAVAAAAAGARRAHLSWMVSIVLLAALVAAARAAPWKGLGEDVARGGGAVVVGAEEDSLRYYSRGTLREVSFDELARRVAAAPTRAVLADAEVRELGRRLPSLVRLDGRHWAGLDLAKGRHVSGWLATFTAAGGDRSRQDAAPARLTPPTARR